MEVRSSWTHLHHLLALQLHVGRPVVDHTDRFLEGDALQRSLLPRRHLTGIVGRPPPLLHRAYTKHTIGEFQGGSVCEGVESQDTQAHTGLHCSSTVNPLQQQEAAGAPATRGQCSPVKDLARVSFSFCENCSQILPPLFKHETESFYFSAN